MLHDMLHDMLHEMLHEMLHDMLHVILHDMPHGVFCPFFLQGGDKLTLNLNSQPEVSTTQLIDLDSPPAVSTAAPTSSLDLLGTLTTSLPAPSVPLTQLSITHFSQDALAGLQRETLFAGTFNGPAARTGAAATSTTDSAAAGGRPSTNPFLQAAGPAASPPDTAAGIFAGQKFATIGRSNPFSSPNKSKNPFLDKLDGAPAPPVVPSPASPMSTSPSGSPEASLEPPIENGSSTLNKIVS